tara:strand:+ start:122 stop:1153 length:1032 start_codon:yes stop_codon:yes gene_type:complete
MNQKKFIYHKKKIDKFFLLIAKLSRVNPLITVLILHEYFRNIYPEDLYIKKRLKTDPLQNISLVIQELEKIANVFLKLGCYEQDISKEKINTQLLYGKLWKERFLDFSLDQTKFLKKLLNKLDFDIKKIKGKKILDMGCGSGRFTSAFAKLGAKKVYGVDLGSDGISVAKKLTKKFNIKNATFKNASVLNMPFKNNYFDFVFCKGVLHHTGNLKRGLDEFIRMIKINGYGYLYLYGRGGIFWYSRKKMRKIMKIIPHEFSINVLKLYGMPAERTIFVDTWYVPIEEHVSKRYLENYLKERNLKFEKYSKSSKPLSIELESMEGYKYYDVMYGDGELRYLIKKV